MSLVSVVHCDTYQLGAVRTKVQESLGPLGGLERFVRPGMRVLLKPNLLSTVPVERAVNTHPVIIQAVTELVQEAGGTVLIGDSPPGPVKKEPPVWETNDLTSVAAQTGARLVPFEKAVWKRLNGHDYFIADPMLEADLVINLPKLKTHNLTLYTGAVKNLFGAIPGSRKREVHLWAPGLSAFSQALVDVLELTQPGLSILDGIMGLEGSGPGPGGITRSYHCLAASEDSVALDATICQAMGFGYGKVLHLTAAEVRGFGVADPDAIEVAGERRVLEFGKVAWPAARRLVRYIPSWAGRPLQRMTRVVPQVVASACSGCGQCSEVCPCEIITPGHPPHFDLDRCVSCFCCSEVCPEGAIQARRNWLVRLAGIDR